MTISLPPHLQKLVDAKVRDGAYETPDALVQAALTQFLHESDDGFAPGELDRLIAEGAAALDRREAYPGPAVFEEIAQMSAVRRGRQP